MATMATTTSTNNVTGIAVPVIQLVVPIDPMQRAEQCNNWRRQAMFTILSRYGIELQYAFLNNAMTGDPSPRDTALSGILVHGLTTARAPSHPV